jgi:hypothetical protein
VLQQRIAIIPTAAGRYSLPEITIAWWNIKTGQQEVARIPARDIEVRQAVAGTLVSTPGTEILPIAAEGSGQVPGLQSEPGRFWLWLSAILGTGWLASILAWWFTRRDSSRRSTTGDDIAEISLPRATKRLHRACASNNATAARDAVLSWANALEIKHRFVNLNQVARYFGNPLKQQLDLLNRSIYSEFTGDWQGDSLRQTCEEITAHHISDDESAVLNGLHPLNP